MKLYLDDDNAGPLLARLLEQAGHDVQLPTDVGLYGEDDSVHLRHAGLEDRSIITGNHRDFLNLRLLVTDLQGHHPGIWWCDATTTRSEISTPAASSERCGISSRQIFPCGIRLSF